MRIVPEKFGKPFCIMRDDCFIKVFYLYNGEVYAFYRNRTTNVESFRFPIPQEDYKLEDFQIRYKQLIRDTEQWKVWIDERYKELLFL